MYSEKMRRFTGFFGSLVLFTLMTPVVETATAEHAGRLCNPDKRRAARVLTQADVPAGANFAGADLRCGDYSRIRFENVNLSGAKLDGSRLGTLVNVNADGASFVNAHIDGASGRGGNLGSFRSANFSGASLWLQGDAAICDGANFTDAQIYSWDQTRGKTSWIGANFSRTGLAGYFVGDDFTRAKFLGLEYDTPRVFTSATFVKADFSKADLKRATFDNANLTDANFNGAKIQGATFYGANLTNVNLKTAVGKAWGLTK